MPDAAIVIPTADSVRKGAVRGTGSMQRGLRELLGEPAWLRLPAGVRARFGDPVVAVDYCGQFDVVRASRLGRLVAAVCRLIGTPIVPRTGVDVPAVVHVRPSADGVVWNREYRWPHAAPCFVRSTKAIERDGSLVERLPARLCMPLRVCESRGVLRFVSTGYYFDLGARRDGLRRKARLPAFLSPGTTCVEHRDETDGWFRFSMTVTHPIFGELFFQTGRFRATGGVQ